MSILNKLFLDQKNCLVLNIFCVFRDFDPCFDEEEDAKPVSSPQPVSSSQSVLGRHLVSKKPPSKPEIKNSDASQSDISDIKRRNGDIKQSDRSVNTKNSETQPNKFPPGSPKKINFGPPKPPRNFDYATSPEEKRLSEIPEEPKKERKLKSPRDLLFNKSKKSRSPPKDRSSPDAKNCAVKMLDDIDDGPREENLYVTLPECKDDISGSPVNTPPPASTPPPLPSSLPPSATKPKQESSVSMHSIKRRINIFNLLFLMALSICLTSPRPHHLQLLILGG